MVSAPCFMFVIRYRPAYRRTSMFDRLSLVSDHRSKILNFLIQSLVLGDYPTLLAPVLSSLNLFLRYAQRSTARDGLIVLLSAWTLIFTRIMQRTLSPMKENEEKKTHIVKWKLLAKKILLPWVDESGPLNNDPYVGQSSWAITFRKRPLRTSHYWVITPRSFFYC